MNLAMSEDVLLQIADGANRFRALAGLKLRRLDFAASPLEKLDFTKHRWGSFCPASGPLTMRLSGEGLLADKDDTSLLYGLFNRGACANLRVIMPAYASFAGLFLFTEISYETGDDAPVRLRLSLQSDGRIDFALA